MVGYAELRNAVGVERTAWKLYAAISYNVQVAYPFAYVGDEDPTLNLVVISYPELYTTLDFRDDKIHPHKGIFIGNTLQFAGKILGSDANDFKVQPELRCYVPISKKTVWASRVSVGFLEAVSYGTIVQSGPHGAQPPSAETTKDYQLTFFRGFFSGGPSSNRGYPIRGVGPYDVVPFLSPEVERGKVNSACGAECRSPTGGFTLWEASTELRFTATGPLSVAIFCDASDVSPQENNIRLTHLHLSCGGGARYDTPAGPHPFGHRMARSEAPGLGRAHAGREGARHLPRWHPYRTAHRHRRSVLMPPHGRDGRARHVLGLIGAVVATTMTFLAATAAAAVVHLDMPPTRRLVATQLSHALHEQFAGDVAIERIGGLSLHGVDGVRIRVKDPSGMQVLFLDGARVRIRALEAARSALLHEGDIILPVEVASIDHVDAAIDGDPAGHLRIANAFAARNVARPEPKHPKARGIRVEAPSVTVRHAWIHGRVAGAPPLDAELRDLAAGAHYDAKLTTAVLERVDLVTRGLPRGVDPRGRIGGHFSMPSPPGKHMGALGTFDGVIAGASISAHARMDGPRVDAVVDARDPSGWGVRSTFGELSIQEEVTVHAEAHGELPRIGANVHVALGRGSIDVDGHVDTSDGTRADATIAARHINLHGIVAAAPASDLGLDTRAHLVIAKSGEMSGDLVLDTLPGTIAGEVLPVINLNGQFTKETAHADGRLLDPRGNADFDVDLTTAGANKVVEAQLHTYVADLSRLPKVGSSMRGRATVDADGVLDLRTKSVAARAHVVAGGVAYGAQKVDNATLSATVQGTIDRPLVDVGIHAGGLVLGERRISVVEVRSRIEPGAVTTLDDAHVDIVKEDRFVSASAHRVQIGGPRIVVEGAVVVGLGEPLLADVAFDANEARVKLDAPSIDLARVARLAGIPARYMTGGHLAIVGDVALRRDGSTAGELHAHVDSFSTAQIGGAKLDLDADFAAKASNLALRADLGETGKVDLWMSDVAIGGSPLHAASWRRARGRAEIDANLDIEKLAALLPRDSIPASELGGRLVVAGTVRRDSMNVPPDLSIHAHTRGLALAGKAASEPEHGAEERRRVVGVQRWHSRNTDVSFDGWLDGTSGFAEVALQAVDKKGALVSFDAKSDLPYRLIAAHPSRTFALLETTPLSARVVVPRRALADLPERAGTRRMQGTIEAELDITGTPLDPQFTFVAHTRAVRAPSVPATLASDADVTLRYDGAKAELMATVSAENHRALEVGAHLDIRARNLVVPTPGRPLAWGGSARVKLVSFPVETINVIDDRGIRGHVSGELVLEDLHENAKLDAHIGLEGLKIGQNRVPERQHRRHRRRRQADGRRTPRAERRIRRPARDHRPHLGRRPRARPGPERRHGGAPRGERFPRCRHPAVRAVAAERARRTHRRQRDGQDRSRLQGPDDGRQGRLPRRHRAGRRRR